MFGGRIFPKIGGKILTGKVQEKEGHAAFQATGGKTNQPNKKPQQKTKKTPQKNWGAPVCQILSCREGGVWYLRSVCSDRKTVKESVAPISQSITERQLIYNCWRECNTAV